MYFDLNEEERQLKRVAREFLGVNWRLDNVRHALDDSGTEIPPELWKMLADLGWLGLPFPEELGGVGLGLVSLCVLAEEAGRVLLPGPFLSTVIAGMLLNRHGSDELRKEVIPALVEGQCRLTVALNEPDGGFGPESVALLATPDGHGYRLNGIKIMVPDGVGAHRFLIAARLSGERGDEDGLAVFAVPPDARGVTVNPMTRIDGQRSAEVVLRDVAVHAAQTLGEPGKASSVLADYMSISASILAAEMVGGTEHVLEMTTEYAKKRVQFGRPIGSFQAVSHPLVNTLVDLEIGRSLVYAACLALEEGRAHGPALASAAKAWMSDAYPKAGEAGIQLHGGIGYTWESDAHLFLRRSRATAVALGDSDYHRDRIAKLLEQGLLTPASM